MKKKKGKGGYGALVKEDNTVEDMENAQRFSVATSEEQRHNDVTAMHLAHLYHS